LWDGVDRRGVELCFSIGVGFVGAHGKDFRQGREMGVFRWGIRDRWPPFIELGPSKRIFLTARVHMQILLYQLVTEPNPHSTWNVHHVTHLR